MKKHDTQHKHCRDDCTRAGFKLWISSVGGLVLFGEGRCRLLEAIDKHGSLSEAARQLGISYRKAWGDLRKTEQRLEIQLLEKTRGGKGGGFSGLTKEGKELLVSYREFRTEVSGFINKSFQNYFSKLSAIDPDE